MSMFTTTKILILLALKPPIFKSNTIERIFGFGPISQTLLYYVSQAINSKPYLERR